MTEVKDSQAVAVREAVEVDRVTLRRLAAGEVAEAYQLDYFREYPVTKHGKPSGDERARAWQKAETDFPQFAERITTLGRFIPGSQEARAVSDYHLKHTFEEVVNPLAREFLINIVMIGLGSGVSSFAARDHFIEKGEGMVRRVSDSLGEKGLNLSSLTPTDVAEAYLAGRL